MASQITSHSEALPRVLEVHRFVAARELEVGALYKAIKASENVHYGVEALPRHLRRRATSHNSYRQRRRPRQLPIPLHPDTQQDFDGGEGEVLYQGSERTAPRESRAMRRRPGRLRAAAAASCAKDVADAEADTAPRRLETHVWHAKRFAMHTRWGHTLAEGAPGRGMGSRSVLHSLHTGVLLHDASYMCPLHLSGPPQAIQALFACFGILRAAIGLSGNEGTVMLRRPGTGADQTSLAVARLLQLPHPECEDIPPEASPVGAGVEHWALWLHPACYLAALPLLLEEAKTQSISLTRRSAHWRRLELRGPASDRVLTALLGHALTSDLQSDLDGAVRTLALPDPRLLFGQGWGSSVADAATVKDSNAHDTTAESLWMAPQSIRKPFSDEQVAEQRRVHRLESVGLMQPSAPCRTSESIDKDVSDSMMAVEAVASCPMLLVRRRLHGMAFGGWSIVLPASWVMPIWLALVFAGSRAVGIREWHWAATDQGQGFYPEDFCAQEANINGPVGGRQKRSREKSGRAATRLRQHHSVVKAHISRVEEHTPHNSQSPSTSEIVAGGIAPNTTDVLNERAVISDMTRVHVKMRGRGIALKGSALRATDVEPGDVQSGLLGFVTSELPRGLATCALAGASGLCSSSALALYKFRMKMESSRQMPVAVESCVDGNQITRAAVIYPTSSDSNCRQVWL